ncbi:MAG: glycoside hydrolase family 71/99-like protein [Verrucomicrobiota bacterium]
MRFFPTLGPLLILLSWLQVSPAQDRERLGWEEVFAEMKPFSGPSVPGVDTSTLHGKVVTGYQGWFGTPEDGYSRGWVHYGRQGRFSPSRLTIDYWPHTEEMDPEALARTRFVKADGSPAYAFSSAHPDVAMTHFRWMKEYGIEAAFLQRFATNVRWPSGMRRNNRVLDNVRAAANAHGRAYVVMYDLSSLPRGGTAEVKKDWKRLVDHMQLTRDPKDQAYLSHKGKPLIALWGVGFHPDEGKRNYTLEETADLIRFFRDDADYGNLSIMLGVPTGWRTLDRDADPSSQVHDLIRMADVVSPWTPGRYRSIEEAEQHAQHSWLPDLAWCQQEGLDYLPVVFPGFSWGNLYPGEEFNAIPRQGGHFLWAQYRLLINGGCRMIYQAMFDEIDEGTQILKVDAHPPVAPGLTLLSYDPLPDDHYLWLVGQAQDYLASKKPAPLELPRREGHLYPEKKEAAYKEAGR